MPFRSVLIRHLCYDVLWTCGAVVFFVGFQKVGRLHDVGEPSPVGTLVLLSMSLLCVAFVVGPWTAFFGHASALTMSQLWRRLRGSKEPLLTFEDLYYSFFGKPLRMVNPPPDDP